MGRRRVRYFSRFSIAFNPQANLVRLSCHKRAHLRNLNFSSKTRKFTITTIRNAKQSTTTFPSPFNQYFEQWVVFTAKERAFRPLPSHTPALLLRGSRLLPSKSSTKSASSPRRVQLHPRSVLSSETLTVSPRSRLLLVCLCFTS
jgi:hypothetical protein